MVFYAGLSVLFLAISTHNAISRWSESPYDPVAMDGAYPQIVSDDSGGVWVLSLAGLQHVDRYGDVLFDSWSNPYRGQHRQYFARDLLRADDGDIFVLTEVVSDEWDNENFPNSHLYVQRFSQDGEVLWGDEGIRVDRQRSHQTLLNSVSDSENGLIVYYGEHHDEGISYYRPHLIRITDGGEYAWEERISLDWRDVGVNLWQWIPPLVSDNAGGVIIMDPDFERMQLARVDAHGRIVWRVDALELDSVPGNYFLKWDAISDGTGGVVLGAGRRSGRRTNIINAVRVSNAGDTSWRRRLYCNQGVPEDSYDVEVKINIDMTGRFYVSWHEDRVALRSQALDFNGEVLWDTPVTIDTYENGNAGLINGVNQDSGVSYVWYNNRNDGRNLSSVKAQRYSSNGESIWEDSARVIMYRSPILIRATTDCNGGAIVAAGNIINLAMVNRNGVLGRVLDEGVVRGGSDYSVNQKTIVISLFPQPANSHLIVILNETNFNGFARFSIRNMIGRAIESGNLVNGSSISLSATQFPSGFYTLQIDCGSERMTKSFTIMR